MGKTLKKPYKIGVTGSIATGKSVVRNILDSLNVETIDADEVVHDLLQNDKDIIEKITDIFGQEILKEDGGIDRKELAKLAFSQAKRLKDLESIIHPKTYEIIENFMRDSKADIIAAIIPLLIENSRQYMFDSVWLIMADEQQQIERLNLRDNMAEEEARQRIDSQMPQHIKMAMADVIIDNSGPFEEVVEKIKELILELRDEVKA